MLLGGAAAVIRSFSLTGQVSCALMDPETGVLLDAYSPEAELPPASVTKALTAAYGLQKLGRDFQFVTRLSLQGRVTTWGVCWGCHFDWICGSNFTHR